MSPCRKATADVFESWTAAATARFAAAGMDERDARRLAIQMLCALEGAFVLSRAMRSTEPLEAAGESSVSAIHAALASRR